MMQPESVCSEVSSYIWKQITIRMKKHSSRHTRQVAENMAGKKVIVRTLDIGADKQVDYFNLDHEENPAMGYRAIRICLDRRDIFRTQLRALLRASAYGNIGIMYPMIISVDEVKEIKKIVESIKAELTEKGIEYGEV